MCDVSLVSPWMWIISCNLSLYIFFLVFFFSYLVFYIMYQIFFFFNLFINYINFSVGLVGYNKVTLFGFSVNKI